MGSRHLAREVGNRKVGVRNLAVVVFDLAIGASDRAVAVGNLSVEVWHHTAGVPDLAGEASHRVGPMFPGSYGVLGLGGEVGGAAGVVRRANRVASSFTNWSSPNDGGAFLTN